MTTPDNLHSGFIFDVAGSGIPHGSMYNHDTPTTVTISSSNTAVRIPSGFTAGQTKNVTFANARELVVLKAGRYLIAWQISFQAAAGSNMDIEGFIMIDNVMNTQASAHRKIGTGTDTGSMSGVCILNLAANQVVSLGVLNETDTNNIVIEHANLGLVQVSG